MSVPRGTIRLTGRGGLGDAVYSRMFVRAALQSSQDVEVETSWPWVFCDLPVRCVKREGGLGLQAWHGERAPAALWSERKPGALQLSVKYSWDKLALRTPILRAMEQASGLRPNPVRMDLPPLPPSPLDGSYAIVRPPSVRVDFPAPREPEVQYLQAASMQLRAMGLRVATLCQWVPGLEEPAGVVMADRRFENGELTLPEAFALIAGAQVVVAGPSWMIPACLATATPMIVVGGGIGGRNNPRALVDQRLKAEFVRWLLPDQYCMCSNRQHNCPRKISRFPERFSALAHDMLGAVPC